MTHHSSSRRSQVAQRSTPTTNSRTRRPDDAVSQLTGYFDKDSQYAAPESQKSGAMTKYHGSTLTGVAPQSQKSGAMTKYHGSTLTGVAPQSQKSGAVTKYHGSTVTGAAPQSQRSGATTNHSGSTRTRRSKHTVNGSSHTPGYSSTTDLTLTVRQASHISRRAASTAASAAHQSQVGSVANQSTRTSSTRRSGTVVPHAPSIQQSQAGSLANQSTYTSSNYQNNQKVPYNPSVASTNRLNRTSLNLLQQQQARVRSSIYGGSTTRTATASQVSRPRSTATSSQVSRPRSSATSSQVSRPRSTATSSQVSRPRRSVPSPSPAPLQTQPPFQSSSSIAQTGRSCKTTGEYRQNIKVNRDNNGGFEATVSYSGPTPPAGLLYFSGEQVPKGLDVLLNA
jgi:hypothetical protein